MGTAIVIIVLVLVVGLIIWKMSHDKKQGISSCGCGCSACPNAEFCHAKKKGKKIST